MQPKPWWMSKTVWLNTAATLLEVGQLLTGTHYVPEQVLIPITGILNIIVRRLTNAPMTFTKPTTPQ